MGTLIVTAQVTVDGVVDTDEQWFRPGPEHNAHAEAQLRAADALVLGRKTYAGLARVWPTMSGPLADLINPLPKYVASRTLREPLDWNARLLSGSTIDAVIELKRTHDLLMYGCGPLAAQLCSAGLVDEVRLGVHPVVFGHGQRLFGDDTPVRLSLLDLTRVDGDIVEYRYRPQR